MAKQIINILIVLLLGTFFVGCVSTQSTMLSSKHYPPISPSEVNIYLSVDDIPGEYEKVAIINAQGSSTWTNENTMYEAVREEAAEIGANGVLIGKIDEASSGEKIAGAIFGVPTERRGEMVAIFVYSKNK